MPSEFNIFINLSCECTYEIKPIFLFFNTYASQLNPLIKIGETLPWLSVTTIKIPCASYTFFLN